MDIDIIREISYVFKKRYYSAKSFFAYRDQAVIWLVFSIWQAIISLITITIIYSVSAGISGWSYYQVLFLSQLGIVSLNIIYVLFDPGIAVQNLRYGGVDTEFTKPYSKLTIVGTTSGWIGPLVTVFSAIIVIIFALMHTSFNVLNALGFFVLFVIGEITLAMVLILISLINYHFLKEGNFLYRVMSLTETAGNYPLNVFGLLGQLAFSLVIPIGLAFFYPASVLFGKIGIGIYIAALLTCIALIIIAYKGFYYFMRTYTSGGG